eukprot:g12785.t1
MCSARETTHINHIPVVLMRSYQGRRDSPSQAKDHLSKILLQRLITTIAQSPSSEGPPSRPVRLLRNSARMTPTRTGLLLTTVQ